jgi:hypothetical protein
MAYILEQRQYLIIQCPQIHYEVMVEGYYST